MPGAGAVDDEHGPIWRGAAGCGGPLRSPAAGVAATVMPDAAAPRPLLSPCGSMLSRSPSIGSERPPCAGDAGRCRVTDQRATPAR
jgi:hypothetical protein